MVEDEETLAKAVSYSLQREGYQVQTTGHGELALEVARRVKPQLVLLDLMLPKLDGLEVCRILRKESVTPIIMLTARGDEVDRVVGLELGADDYVTKPFSMRELVARVKAQLRRSRFTSQAAGPEPGLLRAGELELDVRGHSARLASKPLELTPREFEILKLFMQNPGQALSRGQILQRLGDPDYVGEIGRWMCMCGGCARRSRAIRAARSTS